MQRRSSNIPPLRNSTPISQGRDDRVRGQIGARPQLRARDPTLSGEDAPGLDLEVPNITIVDAERTFWDKVVILHGLRHWYDAKGVLRGGGNRISRHYYDLHELMQTPLGERAIADPALGADCVAHARMFFNRPAFDLASAVPPTFALMPEGKMYDALKQDYAAMSGMIFGTAPSFEAVSESIAEPEKRVNEVTLSWARQHRFARLHHISCVKQRGECGTRFSSRGYFAPSRHRTPCRRDEG